MALQELQKEYRVHVYETGPDGRLRLYSLFDYMQDLAGEHAVKLGYGRDDLMKRNHIWVLSRMYAIISEWPVWEDSVIIKTWPAGTDKLFAMRNYDIKFQDGRQIAFASSSWLIIDRSTKKIQRPDEFLATYNRDDESITSHVQGAGKLKGASADGHFSPVYRVIVSDLDINLHTNNVNYLKWIYNSYDLNFIMNHIPSSVEINYLAESIFNEDIVIRTSVEDKNRVIYNHSVFKSTDNRELCRVRLRWKTSNPDMN